jgi:hypothetical protein
LFILGDWLRRLSLRSGKVVDSSPQPDLLRQESRVPEERRRIPAEDHDLHSRRYVAHLRATHRRSNDDWEARTLVDELCRRSREFAQLWDQHEVAPIVNWPKRVRHPKVGVISFESEALSFQNPAEVLLVFTAAPDSDDAERLAFLSASVSKHGPTR